MRARSLFWMLMAGLICTPALASAKCVTLVFAGNTPEQVAFLYEAAASLVEEPLTMQSLPGDSVEFCAPTADLPGLTVEAITAAARAMFDAHRAATDARQVEMEDARAAVKANVLCDASPALLGQRIDDEKAAVQAGINAITDPATKAAMTLANNRTWAAIKFMVRCNKERATIGGE